MKRFEIAGTGLFLVVAALAPACNAVTGAGDLMVIADGAGGAAGATSGNGAVTHASSGGPAGTGSAVTTGGGTTTTATTTTGAGVTTGAGATSSSSASSGGGTCQYPTGGYGVDMGSKVSPNLAWQGYPENSTQLGSITIQDYFDCDGSRGVNALLVLQSALWCGACQQEATEMPAKLSSWSGKGIRVLTLIIEDTNQSPATPANALSWKNDFGLTGATVAADPGFSFSPGGSVGLPMNILIDPRTMQIVSVEQGYSGDYSAVEQLAQKNAH